MGVDVEGITERIAEQTINQTYEEYYAALKQAFEQAHNELQAAQPAGIRNTGEDGRSQTRTTESGAGQEGLTEDQRAVWKASNFGVGRSGHAWLEEHRWVYHRGKRVPLQQDHGAG